MVLLQEGNEQRMALADRRPTDYYQMALLLQRTSFPVKDCQSLFFKPQPEEDLKAIDLIEVEGVLVKGSSDDATLVGTLQAIGRPLAAVA